MRKLMLILVFNIVLQVSIDAVAFDYVGRNEYEREMISCIKQLEIMDIVRNVEKRWDFDDPIIRRDVFKMAFILKNNGRDYLYWTDKPDGMDAGVIATIEDMKKRRNIPDFADIEIGSDDYYFAYSLTGLGLLYGDVSSVGKTVVDFDRNATYYEALAVICRLFFEWSWKPEYSYSTSFEEPFYYSFSKNIGMINSTNPLDSLCPQIEISQLDMPITAYEFMYILNRAMYIPTTYLTYTYQNPSVRYIDFYTKIDRLEVGERYEDIVD